MIACCIPMLVIAVVLVVTGLASPAFLAAAFSCTLMMALMMGGMSHGDGNDQPWPCRPPVPGRPLQAAPAAGLAVTLQPPAGGHASAGTGQHCRPRGGPRTA